MASTAVEAAATSSAVLDSAKASTMEASSSMDLSAGTSNCGDRGNEWQKCLENAVNAIVNIRVLQVKPFEATGASSSYATGFVVSLEHNLVLSKYAHPCSCMHKLRGVKHRTAHATRIRSHLTSNEP